jgi:choline dehydrogenase-like flavoprotein
VTDSYGRTHDHENLFVVGAPTLPTAGCTNGTLTFAVVRSRARVMVVPPYVCRRVRRRCDPRIAR